MKLIFKILLLILAFIFLCFVLPNRVIASDVPNFTLEQQNVLCETLNFSFVDCYGFWKVIESLNETYEVCNYSNYTPSSECFNESVCSEDLSELEKIDEYANRGFEPVFENGIITNFKKVDVCDIPVPDCKEYMRDEVTKLQAQYSDSKSSNSTLPIPEDKSNLFTYILIGFLGFCGFFLYNKFMKDKGVQNPMSSYGNHPAAVPSPDFKDDSLDNTRAEIRDLKLKLEEFEKDDQDKTNQTDF